MRWQVASIDLSEPLTDLWADAGYDGVRAVFFWNGIPLGHARLAAAQLPLEPKHLAAIAAKAIAQAAGDYLLDEGFRSAQPGLPQRPLENPAHALECLLDVEEPIRQLARRHQASWHPVQTTISVAICTRERPEDLARCLESLENLSERPSEVLVIDNAPLSFRTREVAARFPGVRYKCEPRPGLSAARNAALAAATGDIVAFIDDDTIVHPNWLSRIHACFADPQVMVATGLVLPAELETPAQMIFEQSFQFFHQGYRRRRFDPEYFAALRKKGVPVWEIGAGANMAIRRKAYELGHTFDTRLGPGVFGGCGEDSEFWYGVLAGGWTCVYEPSACVFHYHRRELAALRRLVHHYMQGHVAALILQFVKYRDIGNLRRLCLRLPAEYVILFLRLIVTGFSLDYRILMRGALGCLSGLRFALFRKFQRA
jgi:glycosyltransferase involved in cell wall biosynthesis